MVMVTVLVWRGGKLSIDFSLYRWNFVLLNGVDTQTTNMYIIFPDFLFLTIRRRNHRRRRALSSSPSPYSSSLPPPRSFAACRPPDPPTSAGGSARDVPRRPERSNGSWPPLKPSRRSTSPRTHSHSLYDSPTPKVTAHPAPSSRKRGPNPLWTSHRRDFARCRRPSARYHFRPSLQPASTATSRSSCS